MVWRDKTCLRTKEKSIKISNGPKCNEKLIA